MRHLHTRLYAGDFDEILIRLYGAAQLDRAHGRCAAVLSGFAETFCAAPEALFSAPGGGFGGTAHAFVPLYMLEEFRRFTTDQPTRWSVSLKMLETMA